MPALHKINIPPAALERGFWLYAWKIEHADGHLVYVGRTGDNSSPNASAAFQRMGQHLGRANNQNALLRHLGKRGISVHDCTDMEFIAYGPLFPEIDKVKFHGRDDQMAEHKINRDLTGALEKRLCDELVARGYDVLNRVNCQWPLNEEHWEKVWAAFEPEFVKT